jgi:hypothetical protein
MRHIVMRSIALLYAGGILLTACSDPSTSAPPRNLEIKAARTASTSAVTVTSANPWDGHRNTTIDVEINGTGFDAGSQASFELHGIADSRVHVNGTRYVSSTLLVANTTIAADAPIDKYDAIVVTATGKKGIGTELFVIGIEPTVLNPSANSVQDVNSFGVVVGGVNGGCSGLLPIVWGADGVGTLLPSGSYCSGNALSITSSGIILASMSGGPSGARVLFSPSGTSYSMTELPPAPDGSRPNTGGGMNENLEIIGWLQSPTRLYWYSPSTGWLPMQTPSNAVSCQTFDAISNNGQIAAKCVVGKAPKTTTNAYYWANRSASPVLLPTPSGSSAPVPYDINDAGVIVGYTSTRAVKWTPTANGYTAELLPDAGFGASAVGISADGVIIGKLILDNRGTYVPVMWPTSGGYRILSVTQGAGYGYALAIAQTTSGWVLAGTDEFNALRWSVSPQQ